MCIVQKMYIHEFGTIVKKRNIKQVKYKLKLLGKLYVCKLLGKLYVCKLGTILQF